MKKRLSHLKSESYNENQYIELLGELFEKAGWRVKREASFGEKGASG